MSTHQPHGPHDSRACDQTFDSEEYIKCLSDLVLVDADWIPRSNTPGYSMYIRPTLIGTEVRCLILWALLMLWLQPTLGVKMTESAKFFTILRSRVTSLRSAHTVAQPSRGILFHWLQTRAIIRHIYIPASMAWWHWCCQGRWQLRAHLGAPSRGSRFAHHQVPSLTTVR